MAGLRYKGIEWVAIDPRIAKDARVILMAEALGRDRFWVAGHFPQFFGEVAEQQPDGDLSGVSDITLDACAGDVEVWGKLVREHLCTPEGKIRAWGKFMGAALKRLERDRIRKRGDGRGRPPAPGDGKQVEPPRKRRGVSAEVPRNVHGNGAESPQGFHAESGGTVTVTETEDQLPPLSAGAREAEPLVTAFLADVEQDTEAREFLLDFRRVFGGHRYPDVLVREFRAMGNGMNGPGGRAVPLSILGQALRDQMGNGQQLSMDGLRIYADRLMRPRPVRSGSGGRVPHPKPATKIPDLIG